MGEEVEEVGSMVGGRESIEKYSGGEEGKGNGGREGRVYGKGEGGKESENDEKWQEGIGNELDDWHR